MRHGSALTCVVETRGHANTVTLIFIQFPKETPAFRLADKGVCFWSRS